MKENKQEWEDIPYWHVQTVKNGQLGAEDEEDCKSSL